MANTAEKSDGQTSEAPVSELVKQLSEQTSRLARQEVELAKAELAIKGKRAGIGAARKDEGAAGRATGTGASNGEREGGRAMGQDPGTGRTAMSDTRDPEQLREEIEATREELGETVEALAEKTDVKAQAKRKLEDTKESM